MEFPVFFTREGEQFKKVDANLQRMAEIAKERLDIPKSLLHLLYVKNLASPEPLREIIKGFINGKYKKEEAIQKLDALK